MALHPDGLLHYHSRSSSPAPTTKDCPPLARHMKGPRISGHTYTNRPRCERPSHRQMYCTPKDLLPFTRTCRSLTCTHGPIPVRPCITAATIDYPVPTGLCECRVTSRSERQWASTGNLWHIQYSDHVRSRWDMRGRHIELLNARYVVDREKTQRSLAERRLQVEHVHILIL